MVIIPPEVNALTDTVIFFITFSFGGGGGSRTHVLNTHYDYSFTGIAKHPTYPWQNTYFSRDFIQIYLKAKPVKNAVGKVQFGILLPIQACFTERLETP